MRRLASDFGVTIGNGSSYNNVLFARPSANEWHYYAFVINTKTSAEDEITPYVDGRPVAYTKLVSDTGAGNFADSTLYWMSRDESTLFGAGSMQNLALYDKTLSSSTILDHYAFGEHRPQAAFSSSPVVATAGVPVHFDASESRSETGSINDYAWDFNGSETYSSDGGESPDISHTFSSPGTYTVDLRVKNSLGETGAVSRTITVGAALGQYEQAVEKTTGIAHFWPMDESSGSSFADIVGGANAELTSGVTLGKTGGLVEDSSTSAGFDGSSGAASAKVDLSGTSKLTVEFWMKWKAFAGDDHLALEFTPNFNENPGGFLVDPDATPGSDFAVAVGQYYTGHNNNIFFERPGAEQWHYYAFVINTEASGETEITPYVDGHEVSYSKLATGTGAGDFADSTLYWMSRDASTLFGAGSMQDLALYEETLSSSTILEHYEHGENTFRPANTTAPSIEGTAKDGQTLTANPGVWSGGTPMSYAYQWQSCNTTGGDCEDIEGATEQTYALSSPDLETKLRVRVTATNSGGSAEATSAASAAIESGAPDELEAPSITGAPNVGEMLHADAGSWGGTGTEVSYQWERCNASAEECADVTGATGSEYELSEADIGSTLRLRVGASNELGSLTALSPPTEEIAAASTLVNSWAPNISGTLQSGQTLTAQAGSWLGEEAISYGYQWLSCDRYGSGCENISGATESSYTLGSGNIGHALRVRASANETAGTVSQTSPATQPVTSAEGPVLETSPVVNGTGLVGDDLQGSNGTWAGEEPLSFAYQWERCGEDGTGCSAISGATSSSYALTEADAKSGLRVVVTTTNPGSYTTEAVSLPLDVSADTLTNVAAPSVSGSDQEGQPLSADEGIWTGAGAIAYTYQWKRCNEAGESCTTLGGATEPTYTPVAGDVGHKLKVVVSASGTSGSGNVSSAATPVMGSEPFAPTNVEAPVLEGNATVGDTLTAEHGLWAGSETISYSYEWQKCDSEGEECAKIEGASAKTYVLPESAIGSTVRVVVAAENTVGSESATSVQSEVVEAAAAPKDTENPVIDGGARDGVKLFAGNGAWTGSHPLHYYYQWERCNSSGESCASIEGATKANYTPDSGDVGSTLRVRVTVSNSLGTATAVSASTPVASATEASITQALEAAEATDPSILASSTNATLEEQTVKPAIGETGEDVSSSEGLTSSTISKETPGEFAVNAANGPLSFTPLEPPLNATTTPTIVNGTAAVFAETSHDTDTFVRPSPLGTTTILQMRSAAAPTSFTWEVGIGSDQELEELPNGDIAVIEPTSLTYLEAELPSEALETPESESTEKPSGEGATDENAEDELESALSEEGMLEPLPSVPTTTTASISPKSGELHPQETETEYDKANSALSYAEEHTAYTTVMVIRAPTVLDASGTTVSAALKVDGNAVTMAVSPSESTKYPVTAALAINAPSDKASATKATEAHYGLSDPNEKPFAREEGGKLVNNLDSHLKSKPLEVKSARLVLYYGTAPTNPRLNEWLKAVKKAGLTPFITLGRCEPVPESYKQPLQAPVQK